MKRKKTNRRKRDDLWIKSVKFRIDTDIYSVSNLLTDAWIAIRFHISLRIGACFE